LRPAQLPINQSIVIVAKAGTLGFVIPAKAGTLGFVIPAKAGTLGFVIPAKAGIHLLPTCFVLSSQSKIDDMDSRFRGNDD
jgi:hypothetical protein